MAASPVWQQQRLLLLAPSVPQEKVLALPGILEFKQQRGAFWAVVYDVRQIQYAAILAALADCLPQNWWARWQASWRQFQDENLRDSLLSSGGTCCNRPPPRA